MQPITVHLTPKDRRFLEGKKKREKLSARVRNRIDILLLTHRKKPAGTVADLLKVTLDTVWRTKKRYYEGGITAALGEKPRPGQPAKYTVRHETELVAFTCSTPPEGRKRWTLELLCEKMQSCVKGCTTMNRESIRLMLKKMNVSLG
jgi:transposase